MATEQDVFNLQRDSHPLQFVEAFGSVEQYCLRLMHVRAYEEAVARARQKNVLEIGCNTGYGTRLISGVCKRIVGVDLSTRALKVAREESLSANTHYLPVDGKGLPFADQSFDLVISFQVIEHLTNYENYLSEIKRVLTPGGSVIVTTPNARIRLDPGMKPWNEFHVREFTDEELSELLAGWFAKVEIRGLFARADIYQIEYDRVQRALQETRRQKDSVMPPAWKIRTGVIRGVKSVLPKVVVEKIRELVENRRKDPAPVPTLAKSVLDQYSTSDFFYRTDNLAESLDLMAICSVG